MGDLNVTFAEIYRIDERKYADYPVKALLFSNRTAKRFKQVGIITVADLLLRTPEQMMKIQGFGAGCLKEVEQALSRIDTLSPQRQEKKNTLPVPQTIPEVAQKEMHVQTLGERFDMDPEDYIEIDIMSIPFSVRASNLFMRNGITTISLLLMQTEEQLRGMRGFGKTCMEEIESRLLALRGEISGSKKSDVKSFTREQRLSMARGDFAFIDEETLTQGDKAFVDACVEAQKMLGADLASSCIETPDRITPILEMVNDFGRRSTWQGELCAILEEVPAHRHDNQAIAYINTFTRHEEERSILSGMYPSTESPLKAIVHCDNLDAASLYLAKRFLNWCRFDLHDEIAHLFTVIYPNERNQQVVQLRAQKKTLDQIGRKFGLTRERIRQLETKMQRAFNARQGRIKIISKINADKNNATIVTPANVAEYCSENLQELLFLLRGCESSNFTYDKDLDVFIIGDDSIHERAFAFVDKLPEIFNIKEIPRFYKEADEEYEIPAELVDKAISEAYRLSGEVYYKSRLSLALIYTEIIKEFYPDGIDAYDPATISQFRQLIIDKYGAVKMPENDRALSARIAGICILCGRGRYRLKKKQYIPKELAQKICNYIEDSDLDIFMTNTLFAVFEKELRKHGVDNKYYLQGILHELYGERFTFTRDYISKDPSITSIYSSIINFIRDADHPVSRGQILERFPGLPEIAISIATSDPEVLNFFGDYYHAESLNISKAEIAYLDGITKKVIGDGKIHHASEVYDIVKLEKPEIFTRNFAMFPFSACSILEYLFRTQYQFSRPFIAQNGVDIASPAERLHEFVYSRDIHTIAEISAFIREARLNVQSILEFIDECNDKFLLADGDTVQSIERIGADSLIAGTVEELVASEITATTPIQDLSCWSALPTISVPWTEWLIYSVLKKWGKKLEVAPSYGQFRMAIPLVSPAGRMDTTPYADAYKTGGKMERNINTVADDLDKIDELLADIISEDVLEEDLWDSKT